MAEVAVDYDSFDVPQSIRPRVTKRIVRKHGNKRNRQVRILVLLLVSLIVLSSWLFRVFSSPIDHLHLVGDYSANGVLIDVHWEDSDSKFVSDGSNEDFLDFIRDNPYVLLPGEKR